MTSYQTSVVVQNLGVYCENAAVMEIQERNLPPTPEIDLTKPDEEAVDQLIEHINVLREQYSTLVRTDYKCRVIR